MKSPSDLWNEILKELDSRLQEKGNVFEEVFRSLTSFQNLGEAISFLLSERFSRPPLDSKKLLPLFLETFESEEKLLDVSSDIQVICERDPACKTPLHPLLFYKGFMSLSVHRIASFFFQKNSEDFAFYLQSLSSEVFSVDIHPKASLGRGIFLDHATSFVVGETAIIEDNVSILHEVTLGGSGKERGDRHPIIRSGVLIGAGAKILGRVEVGRNSKVGAGSVVLNDVPPHTTVAGVPATVVAMLPDTDTASEMDHQI